MEYILYDLGHIGHQANELKHIEQSINSKGYFAKLRNYTDLFGNEGTELITTAQIEYIKDILPK